MDLFSIGVLHLLLGTTTRGANNMVAELGVDKEDNPVKKWLASLHVVYTPLGYIGRDCR